MGILISTPWDLKRFKVLASQHWKTKIYGCRIGSKSKFCLSTNTSWFQIWQKRQDLTKNTRQNVTRAGYFRASSLVEPGTLRVEPSFKLFSKTHLAFYSVFHILAQPQNFSLESRVALLNSYYLKTSAHELTSSFFRKSSRAELSSFF